MNLNVQPPSVSHRQRCGRSASACSRRVAVPKDAYWRPLISPTDFAAEAAKTTLQHWSLAPRKQHRQPDALAPNKKALTLPNMEWLLAVKGAELQPRVAKMALQHSSSAPALPAVPVPKEPKAIQNVPLGLSGIKQLTSARKSEEAPAPKLAKYPANHKLSPDGQKQGLVFGICGQKYPDVWQALVDRGWIPLEKSISSSPCVLRYGYVTNDLFHESVATNRFSDTKALTTKDGLARSLYSHPALDRKRVDSFFPQSYDLTDADQRKMFEDCFRFHKSHCLLRRFVAQGGDQAEDAAEAALSVDKIEHALDVCRSQYPKLKDLCRHLPVSVKERQGDALDTEMPSTPRCSLFEAARSTLKILATELPWLGLGGTQNIWVMKPSCLSRGRGIMLSSRLSRMLAMKDEYIVQKYIENPQLIDGKKFDIRQWVVVTSWNPLVVWFYEDAYLRFTVDQYDSNTLENQFAHLTNNCVSKQAKDFAEKCDETMWHTDKYREFLSGLHVETAGGNIINDPWLEYVQPQMKKIVLQTLGSVQDHVQPRANSWELFGLDFIVSDNFQVWLLEVNKCPDCSYSTSTTQSLVQAMLHDLIRVVIDVEQFGMSSHTMPTTLNDNSIDTGRFRQLAPASVAMTECIECVASAHVSHTDVASGDQAHNVHLVGRVPHEWSCQTSRATSRTSTPCSLAENCGGHTPDGQTLKLSEASDHRVNVMLASLDNTSAHEALGSDPNRVLPKAAETETHSVGGATPAGNLNSLIKLAEEAVKASDNDLSAALLGLTETKREKLARCVFNAQGAAYIKT